MQRIAAFLFMLLIAAAHADEASVKKAVESRFAGLKVESITKTPFFGLYEVLVGEEIIYTDEKVNYIFNGNVIDAKTRRNLTEERLQKLSAIKFDDLPLDIAIKQVRGNGKRVTAVFSDPFCPYCKRLTRALRRCRTPPSTPSVPDPAPRAVTAVGSPDMVLADRAKAYYDFMLNNKELNSRRLQAAGERWLALGRKLAIRATPVSFCAERPARHRCAFRRPAEADERHGEALAGSWVNCAAADSSRGSSTTSFPAGACFLPVSRLRRRNPRRNPHAPGRVSRLRCPAPA
jgi:thiol:disulfide interchange protein DsbC